MLRIRAMFVERLCTHSTRYIAYAHVIRWITAGGRALRPRESPEPRRCCALGGDIGHYRSRKSCVASVRRGPRQRAQSRRRGADRLAVSLVSNTRPAAARESSLSSSLPHTNALSKKQIEPEDRSTGSEKRNDY